MGFKMDLNGLPVKEHDSTMHAFCVPPPLVQAAGRETENTVPLPSSLSTET